MKKSLSISALSIGMSLAAAVPAFALTLNTIATGSANTTSSSSANTANVGVGVSVSGSMGSSTTSAGGVKVNGSAQNTVTITTTGSGMSSASVQNDADLDDYSMSVKQSDSSISEVSSDDSSVSVGYKVPAKLFGFISVNMTEKASVEVDSQNATEVYVSRPWWSVFAKADDRKDMLAAKIKARVPSSVSASSDAKLNASTKAQFISAIQAGAHETFSGSASAAGSAQY